MCGMCQPGYMAKPQYIPTEQESRLRDFCEAHVKYKRTDSGMRDENNKKLFFNKRYYEMTFEEYLGSGIHEYKIRINQNLTPISEMMVWPTADIVIKGCTPSQFKEYPNS